MEREEETIWKENIENYNKAVDLVLQTRKADVQEDRL